MNKFAPEQRYLPKNVCSPRDLGAKIYLQEFLGDGPQKKLAASYSKNDWVLSLDADERLEEDLINHINSIDLALQDCEAYSFRRRNFCGKKTSTT